MIPVRALKLMQKILKRLLPTPKNRCTQAQKQYLGNSPSHSQPLYHQSLLLPAIPTVGVGCLYPVVEIYMFVDKDQYTRKSELVAPCYLLY